MAKSGSKPILSTLPFSPTGFASDFSSLLPLLSFDFSLSHIIKLGVAVFTFFFFAAVFTQIYVRFVSRSVLALAGVPGDQWSRHTLHKAIIITITPRL